jgi:hypothetical protein
MLLVGESNLGDKQLHCSSKLPCIHMHLYETSGIQYFDDNIVIYIQGLCKRNPEAGAVVISFLTDRSLGAGGHLLFS